MSNGTNPNISGCFSIECCTITWTLSGTNYSTAQVNVSLNGESIGSNFFDPNQQDWSPDLPSQVGNCKLSSLTIQGQTATPTQNGQLLVQTLEGTSGTNPYGLQNQLLQSWNTQGQGTNNSNC